MAELVNLRPLFPGSNQLNQINKILGDPLDAYGVDTDGSRIGGGPWIKGIKLADSVGFQFAKVRSFLPCVQEISSFSSTVSSRILRCSSKGRFHSMHSRSLEI